jgi:DNA-binding CsgD family transcriptional regulator
MKSFFRNLVLRWFNKSGRDSGVRLLQFDAPTLNALSNLAIQEQRQEEDLAVEMLAFALIQRNVDDENLAYWRLLSRREQEIAALTGLGYTNQEIGEYLSLSPETVKSHMYNLLRKFGFSRKHQLRVALRNWDFSSWEKTLQSGMNEEV